MSDRPIVCPSCGKGPVVDIIYGYITEGFDGKPGKDFVMGGCCVTDNDPAYHCIACDYEFGRPREIPSFIMGLINAIEIQSESRAFRSEVELQGFAFAFLSRLADRAEWDRPTTLKYRRGSDHRIRPDERGRRGLMDLVITHDGRKAGLEMEYPRGKGRDPELMNAHFANDCMKLSNEGDLDERYLLVFTYRALNGIDFQKHIAESGSDIRFILIPWDGRTPSYPMDEFH
jgi:hypothetical protein